MRLFLFLFVFFRFFAAFFAGRLVENPRWAVEKAGEKKILTNRPFSAKIKLRNRM